MITHLYTAFAINVRCGSRILNVLSLLELLADGHNFKTVWPSGLRRWLKAPFRKGVGSNPTAVTCSLIRQPFRECHATSLVHASHIPGALLCGPLLHVVCWRLWEWATSDASSVLDSSPTPQSSIMSRGQTTRDQAGGQYCPSLGQLAHRGNLDISHSPQ